MSEPYCWGIFREQEHSPGRENDDAEILRLTGKHLEARGFQVTFKTPEEIGPADPRPLGVFLMCERLEILDRLRALEVRGIPLVNSPRAVLNTYRERMIALFDEANVAFIESRLVATDARNDVGALPVWVKRADVHNTQAGDVTFASTREGVTAVLEAKFYGIGAAARSDGAPGWFRWFYHKEQRVAGHPFEPAQLARAVRRAALALGLDIYGGDAIVTATGGVVLLDVNAWPSFALFREEAAERIAAHVALRFAGASR